VSGSALAEETTMDKAQNSANSAGQKIDSSMNKVGNFMDDSAITAKVKAALVDDENIKSTDISVKTEKAVVTLSGFVESQAQAEQAVTVAKGVEGVSSVSDKLHVCDGKEQSVKGYAGDTATTSEIKAKLLADDIVPSRKVKVETTDGVVQLSGTVDSQAQVERAETIAKAVDGVKSVKNDLKSK
jgi:hyperosmotically inducible protein